ncbi:MAG TPA: alpha/beta hydrolase [Microbacterium sp.]|nr:alpha/beta hydrolase [Microbacterium sp.]
MEPERRTLTLPWGDVSYLEWQPATGSASSTVLLLHGGGLDSAALSWGGAAPAIAEAGLRVIAPDHPGYGESHPAPWPATQERLVAYVGEIVDALHLDRYAIGGLSLGGGMTVGHVLDRPRSVTGAMLLGSYGLMDRQLEGVLAWPVHTLTWLMLRSGVLRAITRAYGNDRKKMARSLRSIIRSPEQRTPELLEEVMTAAARGEALTSFEQWQRDQFLWSGLKTNYTNRLHSISCPVLVVHGDRDTGVPVARAEEAARRLPDAQLVVAPDAGHWVQRDRPEIVVPAVIDFLKTLE